MSLAEISAFEELDQAELTLTELAEHLLQISAQLHQQFDQDIWKNNLNQTHSYHNHLHVDAATKAASLLIQAAANEGNDPLEILKELQKWNQGTNFQPIQPGELVDLFKIALSMHDLGNIMDESFQFHQNGYQAEGAEARSAAIAKKMLTNFADEQILAFIQHLILETTYQGTKTQPFSQVMRIIDQIGGPLFQDEDERITSKTGLLAEMKQEEGEKPTINPEQFFNFVQHRFPELAHNPDQRQRVLDIWEKELPQELDSQDYGRYKEEYFQTK